MSILATGVILFAILHLLPAVPKAKAMIVARTGARLYGPLFGTLSVVALLLIWQGWRGAGFVPLYEPPAWGRFANIGLSFLAFLCLGVFLFRGGLRQRLRFPMGFAVLLWGTGHLLANGDLRSLILFGGLMAYGLVHMGVGLANGARPTADVRAGHDLISLLAGAALYVAMTQLHPVVIGVPVLALPM
jgi:uncharacterized membrane protein